MTGDLISTRALGRATLARQFLLERVAMAPFDLIEHLVGLQAQEPPDPYLALWSRIEGFDPEEVSRLMVERRVVRMGVMRGTIHMVSADDALELRPLVQRVYDQQLARHGEHKDVWPGVDLEPVVAIGRAFFEEQPRTGKQLRALMAERFPDQPPAALADACRFSLALVQVPPRGLWQRSAQVTSTTAEVWLGRPLATAPSIDRTILRYLGAFGPASVADASTWSRLTALREVFERLRPQLRTFRDERGRELFDLPDAPRPDADVPAPVRFLPEYDNVLLSHQDRSRFLADDERGRLGAGERRVKGSVLADGRGVATWRNDNGVLTVDHLPSLKARTKTAIAAEGRRMVQFVSPDAEDIDVRLVPLD